MLLRAGRMAGLDAFSCVFANDEMSVVLKELLDWQASQSLSQSGPQFAQAYVKVPESLVLTSELKYAREFCAAAAFSGGLPKSLGGYTWCLVHLLRTAGPRLATSVEHLEILYNGAGLFRKVSDVQDLFSPLRNLVSLSVPAFTYVPEIVSTELAKYVPFALRELKWGLSVGVLNKAVSCLPELRVLQLTGAQVGTTPACVDKLLSGMCIRFPRLEHLSLPRPGSSVCAERSCLKYLYLNVHGAWGGAASTLLSLSTEELVLVGTLYREGDVGYFTSVFGPAYFSTTRRLTLRLGLCLCLTSTVIAELRALVGLFACLESLTLDFTHTHYGGPVTVPVLEPLCTTSVKALTLLGNVDYADRYFNLGFLSNLEDLCIDTACKADGFTGALLHLGRLELTRLRRLVVRGGDFSGAQKLFRIFDSSPNLREVSLDCYVPWSLLALLLVCLPETVEVLSLRLQETPPDASYFVALAERKRALKDISFFGDKADASEIRRALSRRMCASSLEHSP